MITVSYCALANYRAVSSGQGQLTNRLRNVE